MSLDFTVKEFILGGGTATPTLQFYRRGFVLNGGTSPTWQDIVLSGVGSLTLTNAKANGLNYLKLFGGCEQRNIPAEYTQVNGVTNYTDNDVLGYIDTGIVADVDDMEFDIVAYINPGASLGISWYLLQSRDGTSSPIYGISGSQNNNTFLGSFSGTNIPIDSTAMTRQPGHLYHVNLKCKDGTGTIVVDDLTDGTTATATGTYTFAAATSNIGLFSNMAISSGGVMQTLAAWNTYVYSTYIKKSGVKVLDYISCKNSSNVAGFYDKVTSTLKVATEGGLQVSSNVTVPTPNTPMDIVCNNGTIKARMASGLPTGYTKLDYIQSDGACYIDLGRVPNNTDIIEQKFRKVGTSSSTCAWYGSMPSTSSTTPRISLGSYAGGSARGNMFCGINRTVNLTEAIDTNAHTIRFRAVTATECSWTFDGEEHTGTGVGSDQYEPAITLTSYIFARHGNDGVQVYDGEGTAIYYHREYLANGTLALDCVPVRRGSDNALGLYDLVSNTFLPNQGTGTFTAGSVDDSLEVYTYGTVETVSVKDDNNTVLGTATATDLLAVGDYKDVHSILDGAVSRNVGIKVLDGTEDWVTFSVTQGDLFRTIISDSVSSAKNVLGVLCNYYNIVGSASRVSGTLSGANQNYDFINDNYSTLAGWKQYLSDQYNSGNPVIVIYPLATATSETVTGQNLNIQSGTNIVDITQASIDNLGLEVSYKGTI